MEEFGVSQTKATLGLTLYVLAYGIGPMFLTPLQEMATLGRNPVYILGLAIFVIFNVPIIKAPNFATVLVFRFLTGFVGSPALATGVSYLPNEPSLARDTDRWNNRVLRWGIFSTVKNYPI